MNDATELFRAAIQAAGLTPPEEINPDGELHRFSSNGRRGDDAGWYVLYLDDIPAGSFGCWREGLTQQWCSKNTDTMTQVERDAHRQRVEAMRQQRENEKAQSQQNAAQVAAKRWQTATQATEHPYLSAKGVQAHGVKLEGEALLIPMRDTEGTLHSLQVIDPEGGKRFQSGGRVKGCYHGIGKPEGVLIVCEGYATGASIHEATGQAVAVAFNAGNLKAVTEALHDKFPAMQLILAADDDWQTEGNPGTARASDAARAVDGFLAVPRFPDGRGDKDTDFNDLYRLAGVEAVRACFDFSTLQKESDAQWPVPMPLPDALPPVAPFDLDLLPDALRGWVTDIAERMQCPVDFPAVGAMVAVSSLIGARAVVAPKGRDDWRVVPNLWGAIVGRPGVMKSPALSEAMKPLQRLEASERERWKDEYDSWQLDCKVAELAAKQNEKKASGLAAKDPAKARELLEPVEIPDEPR